MFKVPPTLEAFSANVSAVQWGTLFTIVLSFVVLFYFTEVLKPLFLNFLEMDITWLIERFYGVLGQALSLKKGDNFFYLTEEKYAKCMSEVKAAKILPNKQSLHY
jgi:uncharacterized protein YacL